MISRGKSPNSAQCGGGAEHVRGEGYNVSLVSCGMRRSSDLRGSVIIKKFHSEVEFFIMVETTRLVRSEATE